MSAIKNPRAAPALPPQRRRVTELVSACSIEVSPRDELAGERLCEVLAPGRTVFVNHPGSVTHHDIVAACARLRRGGFEPVPHIAVRRLVSFTQASDLLQRAAGEAQVGAALIIGGDPDHPVGPFPDSTDFLASGLVERHGLREVAFAGYPEGHPRIAARALDQALQAKVALARRRGLDVSLVTQFGFDAAPILRWIAALRERDIVCPVRIGIAGPATVATLAKFAVRCGIGQSLRALARGHTAFARILAEAGPDALVDALVAGEDPGSRIDGLHVFTFGGVRRTADWIRGDGRRGRPGVRQATMTAELEVKRARLAAVEQELSRLGIRHDLAMSAFKFDKARELQQRIAMLEEERAELAGTLPAAAPSASAAPMPVRIRPRRPMPRRRPLRR